MNFESLQVTMRYHLETIRSLIFVISILNSSLLKLVYNATAQYSSDRQLTIETLYNIENMYFHFALALH